jgi:hypothetical protein
MRRVVPAVVVVVLALSGVAQAQPTGSISGAVTDAAWSRGYAEISATYLDCGLDGASGCAWAAAAYLIRGDDSCRHNDPFSIPPPRNLVWLSAGQSYNATVKASVWIGMLGIADQRLCLFVFDRVTKSYWVGYGEFAIGDPPPPPATPVAAAAPVALALTAATAKTVATKALAAKYAKVWRSAKGRKISCAKPAKGRSRCKVQFRVGKVRYSGTVTVAGDAGSAKATLLVHKRRG